MPHMSLVNNRKGFTLVEVMIIAPVVILAIGAFLAVTLTLVGDAILSRTSNSLAYDTQDALNRIEQDVKESAGFLAENNFTPTSPQGVNNTTTKFANAGGTNGEVLILNMIATNGNPTNSSTRYAFLRNQPRDCSQAQDNTPLSYNIVYFVDNDGALWRRVIMPAAYANTTTYSCVVPWQQPSCSPGYSATFCKTNDVKLLSNVSEVRFRYYIGTSNTAVNAVAANSSISVTARNNSLAATTTVQASITATQNVGGRNVERSGVLRVSRLDINASSIAP